MKKLEITLAMSGRLFIIAIVALGIVLGFAEKRTEGVHILLMDSMGHRWIQRISWASEWSDSRARVLMA